MTFARTRLALAAALFLAWVGYLGYLALNYAHPVIVSRSQYMAAEFPVVADVQVGVDGKLKAEVAAVKPLREGAAIPAAIAVANLSELKYPGDKPPQPGRTLLLLVRGADGVYKVAATPPSPGDRGGRVTIYPWTPEVERQVAKWRERAVFEPDGGLRR